MTEPKDAIAAMRRSHDELVTLVEGVGPDGLVKQSGASEWTVAAVLSHLGSAAEIGLNTLTSGTADMDAAQAVWDRWNAMEPTEQAANSLAADERLVEAYEALDDDALANRKIDVGFLPAPVDIGFLAALRLSEVGLHLWDIAVAFDPAATVPAYIVPIVLELQPLFAPFFAKPIGKAGSIAITVSEPDRSYVLEVGEDGVKLAEGQAGDAGTSLTLAGEAFLRLTGGRLGPDHTPAAVIVEGDITLDDLRRVFPGY